MFEDQKCPRCGLPQNQCTSSGSNGPIMCVGNPDYESLNRKLAETRKAEEIRKRKIKEEQDFIDSFDWM